VLGVGAGARDVDEPDRRWIEAFGEPKSRPLMSVKIGVFSAPP
jgi:hypothetical protein